MSAWSIRGFREMWGASITSQAGTWLFQLAVALYALDQGASDLQLALVTAIALSPIAILAPIAGGLADRHGPRHLLIVGGGLGMAGSVLAAAATSTGSVALVTACAIFVSAGAALEQPARLRLGLELAGFETIQSAAALNGVAFNLSRVLGPLVGVAMIGRIGFGAVLVVNAVTYVPMLALLGRLRRLRQMELPLAEPQRGLARAGFRYAWAHVDLRRLLAGFAVLSTLGFTHLTIVPLYAQELDADRAGLAAVLTSVLGAGAVAGNLVAARLPRPALGAFLGATMIGTAGLGAAAVDRSVVVGVFAMALLGMGAGTFMPSVLAQLQSQAEPEFQGRVGALFTLVNFGTDPLGALLVGAAFTVAGSRGAFGLAVVGAVGFLALFPAARLRAPTPAPPAAALAPDEAIIDTDDLGVT